MRAGLQSGQLSIQGCISQWPSFCMRCCTMSHAQHLGQVAEDCMWWILSFQFMQKFQWLSLSACPGTYFILCNSFLSAWAADEEFKFILFCDRKNSCEKWISQISFQICLSHSILTENKGLNLLSQFSEADISVVDLPKSNQSPGQLFIMLHTIALICQALMIVFPLLLASISQGGSLSPRPALMGIVFYCAYMSKLAGNQSARYVHIFLFSLSEKAVGGSGTTKCAPSQALEAALWGRFCGI